MPDTKSLMCNSVSQSVEFVYLSPANQVLLHTYFRWYVFKNGQAKRSSNTPRNTKCFVLKTQQSTNIWKYDYGPFSVKNCQIALDIGCFEHQRRDYAQVSWQITGLTSQQLFYMYCTVKQNQSYPRNPDSPNIIRVSFLVLFALSSSASWITDPNSIQLFRKVKLKCVRSIISSSRNQ